MFNTYVMIGILLLAIVGYAPEVIKDFRAWRRERG